MRSRHLVIGFVVLVALDLLVLLDGVKFLIVGPVEASPGGYSGGVWVHLLAVPAVFAIGIILIGVACTRRRSVPAPRAHEPEDILV